MSTRKSTAFVYDDAFVTHDTGPGHPERPERASNTLAHLQAQEWFADLLQLPARNATEEEIAAIHPVAYQQRVRAACLDGQPFLDSMDVAISGESYDVALLAAGAPLALADAVVEGRAANGFALLRPPGHHAEAEEALGFCLFNNVAVLARYLQRRHGLERIAIVDWDVHHGNGTQHAFEEAPDVMYVSTHQYPYYPGTGGVDETGHGAGRGSIVNCPMTAGAGNTAYERAFAETIVPALDMFRPDALIISAGFDAHQDDPLAQINLTTAFYGWMTERLAEVADSHAGGRIISVLEGGYNLRRLAESAATHIDMLRDVASR